MIYVAMMRNDFLVDRRGSNDRLWHWRRGWRWRRCSFLLISPYDNLLRRILFVSTPFVSSNDDIFLLVVVPWTLAFSVASSNDYVFFPIVSLPDSRSTTLVSPDDHLVSFVAIVAWPRTLSRFGTPLSSNGYLVTFVPTAVSFSWSFSGNLIASDYNVFPLITSVPWPAGFPIPSPDRNLFSLIARLSPPRCRSFLFDNDLFSCDTRSSTGVRAFFASHTTSHSPFFGSKNILFPLPGNSGW